VELLRELFRWLHIFAGVIWIGMLYFFNWVNGPFMAKLDAETKKKVVPELMPRALYWFRWGAAWTWLTGVLLLMLVFYHGGAMFDSPNDWTKVAGALVAFVFVAPFLYDALHKSPLGKDPRVFGTLASALVAAVLVLMTRAGFSYRAMNIHMAAMFGTIMAFNVWFRIWPAQQKIIAAVKAGTPPEAALVALAGARSRHNVYMSVPLVWGMLNEHTAKASLAGGAYGIPNEMPFLAYLLIILVAWHLVWQLYKRAGKVQGF